MCACSAGEGPQWEGDQEGDIRDSRRVAGDEPQPERDPEARPFFRPLLSVGPGDSPEAMGTFTGRPNRARPPCWARRSRPPRKFPFSTASTSTRCGKPRQGIAAAPAAPWPTSCRNFPKRRFVNSKAWYGRSATAATAATRAIWLRWARAGKEPRFRAGDGPRPLLLWSPSGTRIAGEFPSPSTSRGARRRG